MALNYSYHPVFSAHLSDDNLVSPIRLSNGYLIEGNPEKNGDGLIRNWQSNRDVGDCFDYGRERVDRGGSQESVSNDIVDLLPSDPFGMDISTTFTAITGWLEDLDYGGYGNDGLGPNKRDYELFAGLNYIWNNAMRFQTFSTNQGFDDKGNLAGTVDGCIHVGHKSDCIMEDGSSSKNENTEEYQDFDGFLSSGDGGAPHLALYLSLGYLNVQDLLSVERVCRSLYSTVQSESLLWRNIHIDQPLNERITDDVLLQLTSRAQGKLQCLSLVECPRITDDGLKRVLESNPNLIKLSVPGCTRLSIEGVVNSLKAFQSKGIPGIKYLRIGGLYGVTQKHFEELVALLGPNIQKQKNGSKPHFYHRGNFYLSCDDERAIDIEACPKCHNLRLVYDCPSEGCQVKEHTTTQLCRACTLCIARCVQCGRCINEREYEETFCLELLCSECSQQLTKCQEGGDSVVAISRNSPHG